MILPTQETPEPALVKGGTLRVWLLVLAEQVGLPISLLVEKGILAELDAKVLSKHPTYAEVKAHIGLLQSETADEKLARLERQAVARLGDILTKGADKDAITCAREILDRVKGKPVQTQRTISTSLTLDLSLDDIRAQRAATEERLAVFRAQREKLLNGSAQSEPSRLSESEPARLEPIRTESKEDAVLAL